MTCHEARDRLSEYLDNELEPTTRQELAGHLEACAACREEHRLLAAACRLLSTYGPTSCPVDFTHLAARVADRDRRWWGFPSFRYGLAAVTAAAAVVVGLWQWPRPESYLPLPGSTPPRVVVRDVAEVEELHQSFAVQQSLGARDGLVIYAAEWAGRR